MSSELPAHSSSQPYGSQSYGGGEVFRGVHSGGAISGNYSIGGYGCSYGQEDLRMPKRGRIRDFKRPALRGKVVAPNSLTNSSKVQSGNNTFNRNDRNELLSQEIPDTKLKYSSSSGHREIMGTSLIDPSTPALKATEKISETVSDEYGVQNKNPDNSPSNSNSTPADSSSSSSSSLLSKLSDK
jgi:hypothetical protein